MPSSVNLYKQTHTNFFKAIFLFQGNMFVKFTVLYRQVIFLNKYCTFYSKILSEPQTLPISYTPEGWEGGAIFLNYTILETDFERSIFVFGKGNFQRKKRKRIT